MRCLTALILVGEGGKGAAESRSLNPGSLAPYSSRPLSSVSRSLAVGSGSMVCRLASILAPFSVDLSSVWIFIPQVRFSLQTLPEATPRQFLIAY